MKIDISQLNFIDMNLRIIIKFIEETAGLELIITSLYRIGDNGVHGQLPLRGIDIRIRNKDFGNILSERINAYWIYDQSRPEKKCAILHGEGYNLHLHLQTHKNTTRR